MSRYREPDWREKFYALSSQMRGLMRNDLAAGMSCLDAARKYRVSAGMMHWLDRNMEKAALAAGGSVAARWRNKRKKA